MDITSRLLGLQSEMEKYGVNFYYDFRYKKNMKGMEGWRSISFYKTQKGGQEGNVVYIVNAKPYIKIEIGSGYPTSTFILIGTDVWYPKGQRTATDEEVETAISFFEGKIAERKANIERAKNNPSIEIIKRKIYDKFNMINTNGKISVSKNLQFFHDDNGFIGSMVVEKNDFNEVTLKMVYPTTNTETFPTNYYENGLTDHYYGKEKSWEDFFNYCL